MLTLLGPMTPEGFPCRSCIRNQPALTLEGSAEGGQVFPLVEQEQSTLSSRPFQTGNMTGETGVSLGLSQQSQLLLFLQPFTSTQNQTKQQLAKLPEMRWSGVQTQPALSGQTFYLDFISLAAETLSLKGSSPTPVPWCPGRVTWPSALWPHL